jgi:hypothetical protein
MGSRCIGKQWAIGNKQKMNCLSALDIGEKKKILGKKNPLK